MSTALAAALLMVLSLKSVLLASCQLVASSSHDFSTACGGGQGSCSSLQEAPDLGVMQTALLQIGVGRSQYAPVQPSSEALEAVGRQGSNDQLATPAPMHRGLAQVLTIDHLLQMEPTDIPPRSRGELAESASPLQSNSEMYIAVAEKQSNNQMASFISGLVDKLGGVIVDQKRFLLFVPYYSGLTSVQSFSKLLMEIRGFSQPEDGWLKLPPPEKGPILWSMIRSDPWVCDLLVKGDPRQTTCALDVDTKNLDPSKLVCGAEDTCNIEHGNAYRTLHQIGSLPCCSTPPFCSAPTCSKERKGELSTCTKRAPAENLAYMKDPDVWPAYHGNGGSFELDVSKYMDLLACQPDSIDACEGTAFDVVFDLGANTGYYTEKMTTRNFSKSYIMVEANPVTEKVLRERWDNQTWKQRWFSEQVTKHDVPNFEVLNVALSYHSKGVVNMCETEPSFEGAGCTANITSLDHLIAKKLTPAFQQHLNTAQSAFIKIDTEGMDELVLRGMQGLLNQTRGNNADGSTRYLVNFLQFEFAPTLMKKAKGREHFHHYDIKTVTKFLESLGFESFLIGPRFLPLSHGSWDDEFMTFTSDSANNAGVRLTYPHFDDRVCHHCTASESATFTADIFVLRTSHPRATQLKAALGACKESKDFHLKDPQYSF